jgi:hypothetical protein
MRFWVGLLVLTIIVIGVLIYYQCAHNAQRETDIKPDQSSEVMVPLAVRQPEAQAQHTNPYDARQDCLYRLYLLATIVGMFVALGGIYVFYLQTKATQDSARAALLNAQAVINSQRPWIAVRTKDPPIAGSVEFQAECLVEIPAKMIHNYAKWKAVEKGQSLQPIYDTEMLQYPFLIAPPDGRKRVFEFDIESLQADAPLWNDIQNLQQTLYFFGKIEYIDGFPLTAKETPSSTKPDGATNT